MVVALCAAAVLGYDLASEPHFVDESAYFSQSYFARLFAEGRRDDAAWVSYAAFDLPPLPKYLIGTTLWLGGYHAPNPQAASSWYGDTSLRFDPPGALAAARIPSVVLGALGCVAIYGLGVLAAGRGVGALAALLLVMNPLYHTHARRAMSDVPCEAFVLICLFFSLWAWRQLLSGRSARLAWLGSGTAGIAAGLAILSKFSGALALMVVASWVGLALAGGGGWARKLALLGASVFTAAIAAVVFVALNPALTAHPTRPGSPGPDIANFGMIERARKMATMRLDVAAGQQRMFAHNATITPWDKVSTVAVQGFGRFGPCGPRRDDSRIRYDRAQDWGALLWLPWVFYGVGWALVAGRKQAKTGDPPTAWAILDHFIVALTVVTVYLPLAWDRYFLSIQAPSCLLASGVAVAAAKSVARGFASRKGGV
jgi:4-amino-4-deoxy-L-arabinose transferase-like glycosyltransferase